ncbi:leucyl/phenylalanyl-tRNA--protein transferase [Christiangramia forsetii]|uniref:Leucyl/phenylalanyl-tRNA--protein transferase n=2 Tax=Christiangramia forsetii TaxID=411153 RepID=LFTR_CHRFK|nr:leucyl/phenylalanyl-tRNA--protein transferase [Christiangramia forsetii]A0M5U1.1 RecName: Full=Leucyl/phenylalanyl-tRNA--protein transferase; AltName: Full=L/F-transferase; AltName: Full=Leucyltransferase; AltName: Full=Phenyalanyltransferase [Christiangramia forsetii KT0803]GGG32165.1 leucyl/phenylalanyl-tRNA--protein transferase [Christiangramia forsetii]CAL67986.1 leucyl/phenylalanyl-tRNA protein transferase [Christiangramia forsetii KT0803]
MYFINPQEKFPPVSFADEDGLLAVTRDLSPDRLMEAYYKGIFPWYNEGQPVLWWSPDPRMVLFPENLKIAKSMRPYLNQDKFQVTFNQEFEKVIEACGNVNREGQDGTWITPEIKENYLKLHQEGIAVSTEVWEGSMLVGGLYGIYLKDKKVFCGESMFSKASNASKFGFIKLVQKLEKEGVKLIDCQIYTSHLESLGAEEIDRIEFLKFLI